VPAWETYYLLHGGQETAAKLVDANGEVVEQYEYDPYGRATVFSKLAGQWTSGGVSRYGLPFLWKAVRLDEVTGLLQMRNRYYSVETGRFLTRDPIGVWGDMGNLGNEYGYAWGRPLVVGDPMGLQGLSIVGFTSTGGGLHVHFSDGSSIPVPTGPSINDLPPLPEDPPSGGDAHGFPSWLSSIGAGLIGMGLPIWPKRFVMGRGGDPAKGVASLGASTWRKIQFVCKDISLIGDMLKAKAPGNNTSRWNAAGRFASRAVGPLLIAADCWWSAMDNLMNKTPAAQAWAGGMRQQFGWQGRNQ
jgi:RHS repeat-associated protein